MDASTGYLRIGELARRTGVSPELLRAWEQRYGLLRPERAKSGYRLYTDEDEARVRYASSLIADGVAASEAARRALVEETGILMGSPQPIVVMLADRLVAALDDLDAGAAHRALDQLFATVSLESALRDVILPYLRELGDRWAAGDASIGQEHFASSLIQGRLLGLARDWGAGEGPSTVLACPPGEEHELGLVMFGLALSRRGWKVTYLGADTPFQTLTDVVRSVQPELVVLALSSGESLRSSADAIRQLAAIVPVALAGGFEPDEARDLGARILEGDPVEAAARLAP